MFSGFLYPEQLPGVVVLPAFDHNLPVSYCKADGAAFFGAEGNDSAGAVLVGFKGPVILDIFGVVAAPFLLQLGRIRQEGGDGQQIHLVIPEINGIACLVVFGFRVNGKPGFVGIGSVQTQNLTALVKRVLPVCRLDGVDTEAVVPLQFFRLF